MVTHLGSTATLKIILAETATDGHEPTKTGAELLGQVGSTSFGVWEAEPGTIVNAPAAAEAFVVVSGKATICSDGGDPVTAVAGDMLLLAAGETVRWQVEETFRIAFFLM